MATGDPTPNTARGVEFAIEIGRSEASVATRDVAGGESSQRL